MLVSPDVLHHVLGQQNKPPPARPAQGSRFFLGSSTAAKLAEWRSSLLRQCCGPYSTTVAVQIPGFNLPV